MACQKSAEPTLSLQFHPGKILSEINPTENHKKYLQTAALLCVSQHDTMCPAMNVLLCGYSYTVHTTYPQ